MKIYTLYHIPWHIVLCQILSQLTIHVTETDAKLGHVGWAKSDSRTRQILQNIRSHIAQQEELLQQKECDPSLPTCKFPKAKEAEEDESLEHATPAPEIIPPLRFRARHKTTAQLKKDVAHAIALKEQKSPGRKRQKEEEKDSAENKGGTKKVKPGDEEDEIPKKKPRLEAKPAKTVKDEEEEEREKKPERARPTEKRVREEQQKVRPVKPSPTPEERKPAKPAPAPEERKPAKPLKKPVREPEPKKEKKVFRKTEQIEVKREKVKRETKEEARFPEDVPVFSLNTDTVKSEQCKEHSRVYLRQLKRYKLWALMMYDATAKLPSGILQGNTNQYGDFDQCISINATFRKPSRDGVSGIEGKYCLATVDVSSDVPDPGLQHAIRRSRSFDFVKSKINDPGHFIPRFSTINWGLCIPSVCRAEDLENSIRSSLSTYKKSSGLTFDVRVEDKNCVTKKDLLSEYDLKTYVTLLFYASVIAVAVYATLKDTSPKKCKSDVGKLQTGSGSGETEGDVAREGKSNNLRDDEANVTSGHGSFRPTDRKLKALVMAFSLKRNVKKLFIEGESEDNINCIHGIKSIFTAMLFFAHKTIPLALTPFTNRVVFTEFLTLPFLCVVLEEPSSAPAPVTVHWHRVYRTPHLVGDTTSARLFGNGFHTTTRYLRVCTGFDDPDITDYSWVPLRVSDNSHTSSATLHKPKKIRKISNETSSILLRGSIIYTDSFLLISGVLVSFNLSKEIRRNGRILWMRRIIARFIRLTPAMLATLLFYAYVSSYLGTGPMWNMVVSENSRLCREHMWRNLLYIQNFYPFEEMCAPQTHQLALDMQLFLLSPLLVYFLYEYDKIGVGILQALLMVSSILRFTFTANNELSLFIFHGMPISQLYDTANLLYSQSIHRATPYVIGVLIGYYLQKVGKDFKLPNLLVIFGWVLSSCLAVSSLITQTHLTKQDYEYKVSEAAHYAALSPIAWSVAMGWFITACYLGYGGKLNEYLSCRGFVIFSRISYSVYLTQFLVFSHAVGSKRIPEMFSVYNSINLTEMIVIVVISIAVTLLFDIPTVEVKKLILDSFSSRKEADSAVVPESNENAREKEDIDYVKPESQNGPDADLVEQCNEKEAIFKPEDLEEERLVEKLESYQRKDEEEDEAEDKSRRIIYGQFDKEGEEGIEDEDEEGEEEDEEVEGEADEEGEDEDEGDEYEEEEKERESASENEAEDDFWADKGASERY